MKNKSLLLGVVAISLVNFASFASADYDCSTTNMDELKTIFDKQRVGTTLTTEEQTKLDNAESCRPEKTGTGMMMGERGHDMMSGSGMTMRNKDDNMKKGSGTLNETKSNKGGNSKVSSAYKDKIDKKIDLIASGESSSDVKLEKLESFLEKLEAVITKIDSNSSLTDTQKQSYNSILSYFKESLNTKINSIKDGSDDLLDDILSE